MIAPDKTKRAKTASFEELAEPRDADLAKPTDQENPFHEEALPEVFQPMDDATLAFPEGLEGYEDCEDCEGGEMLGGCGLFPGGPAASVCYLPDIRLSTSVEAFKGPLDLDNRNGNFGLQFAVNAGFPLAKRLGIGVQAGTSGVLSDFQGTQFTGSTIRSQNFTTVGLFQRVPLGARRLKWGFAFDWLYDDYYSSLQMSQWRVKLGYELNCCNEIGISARIPNDGDLAKLGDGIEQPYFERFKPVAQGLFYYNHSWATGPSTTAWLGIVDEPGEMIFGGDARLPLTCSWALVGNFNYVLPSASGAAGQDEEMWNVSIGIEFTPGWIGNHSLVKKFSPMFPLANNGTFAIRRY